MSETTPTDPIDDDPAALRAEILRLRDELAVADARREVLDDLVAERDRRLAELDAETSRLADELGRSPLMRAGRAVLRRVRRP